MTMKDPFKSIQTNKMIVNDEEDEEVEGEEEEPSGELEKSLSELDKELEKSDDEIEETLKEATEPETENSASNENEDAEDDSGRKKPNRRKNREEIKQILQSYHQKDTSTLYQELELTRQQVYRTIKDARDLLNKELEQTSDHDKKEKISEFMKKYLPEKKFGGSRNTQKNDKINEVLNDILGE